MGVWSCKSGCGSTKICAHFACTVFSPPTSIYTKIDTNYILAILGCPNTFVIFGSDCNSFYIVAMYIG